MGDTYTTTQESAERRALLALWATPGVGVVGIRQLLERVRAGELFGVAASDWRGLPGAGPAVAAHLAASGLRGLEEIAELTLERVRASRMLLCFPGDPAYPALLRETGDAPPVLFYVGQGGGSGARSLAMVGSRKPGVGFAPRASDFAAEIASRGVAIVSGAAEGVDTACHQGALRVGGETWAFLGSALDEIDPGQVTICRAIRDGGGTVFSEFPPGARANRQTFPRRNRLISGSTEATLVMRAGRGSGALHTAEYAQKQGRRIFILSADPWEERAAGGFEWLTRGATLAWSAESVLTAMEVSGYSRSQPGPADLSRLSPIARRAYEALPRRPQVFEEVQGALGVDAGALVSALCELELSGLVVQHPGKLYERV